MPADALRSEFLEAALWHGSLDRANNILASHPELARSDIHVAAVLGDAPAITRFLEADAGLVGATSPPYGGDALNYLCLSKYLRQDRSRSGAFIEAATVLLDAGADPNTGFWHNDERETALYGAAGVAHHGPLTRLLISRGADPNDPEVVYHTPEDWDLEALEALVESARLTEESLALLLLRKHDWHHTDGIRYLLQHGANPNFAPDRWMTPLQHALVRDNSQRIIELLLDHGADPSAVSDRIPISSLGIAARRGRGDILELAEHRGLRIELDGVEAFAAACARGNDERAQQLRAKDDVATALLREGGALLAAFSGNDNATGVTLLLDSGLPVDTRFAEGDGYWSVAPDSTALHVAAWRAAHDTARRLIERGADVNTRDGAGRTPLVLAVLACVDSYWSEERSTETITALLGAGATTEGVHLPTGYDAADALIAAHRGRTA